MWKILLFCCSLPVESKTEEFRFPTETDIMSENGSSEIATSNVSSELDSFNVRLNDTSLSVESDIVKSSSQNEYPLKNKLLRVSSIVILVLLIAVFFILFVTVLLLFLFELFLREERKLMTEISFRSCERNGRTCFEGVSKKVWIPRLRSDGFVSPPLNSLDDESDITDITIHYNSQKCTLVEYMGRRLKIEEKEKDEIDEDILEMMEERERKKREEKEALEGVDIKGAIDPILVEKPVEIECIWACKDEKNNEEHEGGTEMLIEKGDTRFHAQLKAYEVCMKKAEDDCGKLGFKAIGVLVFPTQNIEKKDDDIPNYKDYENLPYVPGFDEEDYKD